MKKIEIANELLKNSTNCYIKELIKDYINKISALENGECEDIELIRFDNCVSYINNVNFDITGWMLFEIPIFYSHCFRNKNTKENFDLAVWNLGEVTPRYLDDETNEQDSKNIQEAIKNYVI